MTKAARSHTDEVYVVGFIPCCLLPKRRPCSFDPFLHPLLTEIEDSFISGMLGVCNLQCCTVIILYSVQKLLLTMFLYTVGRGCG